MFTVRSLSRLSTKSSVNLGPIPRHLTTLTKKPRVFPVRPGIRAAASQVSNRPGSQTIPHAALNIKEEMGHAIEDSQYHVLAAWLLLTMHSGASDRGR